MSILIEKKKILQGIAVFLPLAEAYLAVKIVRKLVMPLCSTSKITPEIRSPLDFFHRIFANTCLRR